MENFYEVMLESVCKFQGFESIESPKFHQYLNQLQESLKELRRSYQNDTVWVDYTSSNIQMAYLLAYYPHYVGMTLKILKDIHEILNNHDNLSNLIERKIFSQEESLKVCFFAAGPAPESVALCQYINDILLNNCPEILGKKLYLNTFDLDYDKWAASRSVTREKVLPIIIDGKYDFSLEPHRVDLLQPNCLEEHKDIIESSHLFFLQNCLNELAKNRNQFLNNFQFLLDHVPSDSLIIIADLCQYDVVTQLMNSFENLIKEKQWLVIRSNQSGQQQLAQYPRLPQVLTNHLLTGESNLIPKKWTKFNFSVFYKPEDYTNRIALLINYINEIENQGYSFNIKDDIVQKIENFDNKEGLAREWQRFVEIESAESSDTLIHIVKELIYFSKCLVEEKDYSNAIALCTYALILTKNLKYFEKQEVIVDIVIFLNKFSNFKKEDQILIIIKSISELTTTQKAEQDLEKKESFTIEDFEKLNLIRRKAKNLYEIVQAWVKNNQCDEALSIANVIPNFNIAYADFQARALCLIVENLTKIKQYDTAFKIANSITTFKNFYDNDIPDIKINALEQIFDKLIQDKEYNKALSMITDSEDYYKTYTLYDADLWSYNWKDEVFAKISQEFAKHDQFQKALDVANNIEQSERKCYSFIKISRELAKRKNHKQAINAANSALLIAQNIKFYPYDEYKHHVDYYQNRDGYLHDIAICLLKAQEYDQALLVANTISFNREYTLLAIAEDLAQSHNHGQSLLLCEYINISSEHFYVQLEQLNILCVIVKNLINNKQYIQISDILRIIKEKLEKNRIYIINSTEFDNDTREIIGLIIKFLNSLALWGRDDNIKSLNIDDFIQPYKKILYNSL